MDEGSKERAQRFIDERREEILQLCSDMVKIPSENPPGDMGEMASFLRGFLEDRG
ncbi:MAG TPA: M20 family peptidase, partial [Anaerolineae bacterium]|nr:M20 family peptidase [Anaerolineae bacterium]